MKKILRPDEVSKLPLHSSKESLANRFADFFEDKVQKIKDGLLIIDMPHITIPSCDSRHVSFAPVDVSEVTKVVMKSSVKACSLDPMLMRLLRDILPSVVPLTTL